MRLDSVRANPQAFGINVSKIVLSHGIARRRGQGDAVYDRVLTTLLLYLDSTRPEISHHLVYWIGTTNLAQEVDSAAVRRIGGCVERFGHLGPSAFAAVLDTHLKDLPLSAANGSREPAQIRRAAYRRRL